LRFPKAPRQRSRFPAKPTLKITDADHTLSARRFKYGQKEFPADYGNRCGSRGGVRNWLECREYVQGWQKKSIFYTHSHADHYNPEALLKLGVPKAYLGKTWISKAWGDFAEASRNAGVQAPEIVPLSVGETTVCGDIAITALPANHAINATEQALIYLIEKGPVRVIYATDTGGIMGVAARIAGIDPHVKNGRPITGLIMEATMGMGDKGDEDYRLFTHSSVNTVLRTAKMLLRRKRLLLQDGERVYLTHMARTLHGTQAELDASLPAPLKAAYDGLEVYFPILPQV
jgi:phosphoribosyl 1,2-cyclic phosphodiesterase